MQKTNAAEALSNTILLLENKRAIEWELLKTQTSVMQESIKPLNLIKSIFRGEASTPSNTSSLVDTGIGMTAGYIAKQVLWGISRTPLISVLGTILQVGITNTLAKHPNILKSVGSIIFGRIFNKNKKGQ